MCLLDISQGHEFTRLCGDTLLLVEDISDVAEDQDVPRRSSKFSVFVTNLFRNYYKKLHAQPDLVIISGD